MKNRLMIVTLVFCSLLLPSVHLQRAAAQDDALRRAYAVEQDWNDAQRSIPLNYLQAKGQRLFYQYCVWCHADSTPAGPSNRSNLNPVPALMNDGATLNARSDEALQKIVTLGGSAVGKSAMMPPFGRTLTRSEIQALIAFARAIAQPAYHPRVVPKSEHLTNHQPLSCASLGNGKRRSRLRAALSGESLVFGNLFAKNSRSLPGLPIQGPVEIAK